MIFQYLRSPSLFPAKYWHSVLCADCNITCQELTNVEYFTNIHFFLVILNWREVPFLITIMNLAWKLYFFAFINLTLALNTKQSQSEYIIVKRIFITWFAQYSVNITHTFKLLIFHCVFLSNVIDENKKVRK